MIAPATPAAALCADEAGIRYATHWGACYARRAGRWCVACLAHEADLIAATDAELDAEVS